MNVQLKRQGANLVVDYGPSVTHIFTEEISTQPLKEAMFLKRVGVDKLSDIPLETPILSYDLAPQAINVSFCMHFVVLKKFLNHPRSSQRLKSSSGRESRASWGKQLDTYYLRHRSETKTLSRSSTGSIIAR